MSKGITGILLVIIVVVAVVVLFIKNTRQEELHPWDLLPETPDMVLETNNPNLFYEKLKYGNNIWKSLTKIQSFNKIEDQIEMLDSLLDDNRVYHSALFSNHLLIGFYGDGNNVETVFVSSIGKSPDISNLIEFFNSKFGTSFGIVVKQESGFNLIRMINGKTGFNLSLGFAGNMMIASRSETIVLKGLSEFKNKNSNRFNHRDSFITLKKTAGKKVSTKLYFNGGGAKNLLAKFVSTDKKSALSKIGSLVQWTEADLFIKKNELMLNGLSIGDPNGSEYQKLLKQLPRRQEYINILPSNTTLLLFQGFSNFNSWQTEKRTTGKLFDNKKLSNLIGPEVALVSTARSRQEFEKKSFVVIRFNDIEEAREILLNGAKKSGKIAVKTYSQYKINKLESGDFLSGLLGKLYNSITSNYFVFIDDYVIFGNSANELVNWLRFYETGKTLDLNENFKPFSNNLTETSNLTLFVNIRDFIGVASEFTNKQTANNLEANTAAIKDFEGLLFQMSSQPPFIYTSLFVKQSKAHHEEGKALWKVKLEDDIAGKPYPVKDHTSGKYNIIVFDKSFNVYLISYNGSILWKKTLKGLPESSVFQVDYYKNGKIQYLFNTAEYIYLIDKNGNFVKNYPIKVSPSATNGLSVFDYNKKRNYRLLLAQSDKRIYNYDLKGKKIKGWGKFKMPDIVVKPLQRLVANNKDYIIVTDIKNNIKIVNRKGSQRIHIKGKLDKADNSDFYVNRTNGKGTFITTNSQGKLVYISSSGLLRYTDFGQFSPNHFFLYEDFDGKGGNDFIYIDGNKLSVFNRFKKLIFNYTFQSDIQIKPAFFNLRKNRKVLGIVSDAEKTIYLFDKNGNTTISKGLVGEIPFTITSLKNNHEINLITGAGNTLFNYKVK